MKHVYPSSARNVAQMIQKSKIQRVLGSPDMEHTRSPSASRIADFANQSDLFFAHFEHRVRLSLPPEWIQGEDPPSNWVAGILGEPKYQAFRHDLLVASFHPGHRAKWTAHELCHALVGFAYHPGASTLFHALGAWLAELMPVALWYFFDEAGLTRCEKHTGQGALFQTHCDECEDAALRGPREFDRVDARFMREGRAFVERELRAIRRSKRIGLPQGTRYGTVDLASDGLTYAHAHGARLRAEAMERYVAQFFSADQGHHANLESLEARVIEMRDALTQAKILRPWKATRWDYAAQDIGYRMLTVRAQCAGDLGRGLDRVIDSLAQKRSKQGITRAIAAYSELAAAHRRGKATLPSAEEMFAVGYALPGWSGVSLSQLEAGARSACPGAHLALGRDAHAAIEQFASADIAERSPIGRRFARFLRREQACAIADLAHVEAAVTHVMPRDPVAYALPSAEGLCARVRLARGAEVVRIDHDVLSHSGSRVKRAARLKEPRYLGVVRTGSEEVDLLELPQALGEKLIQVGTQLTRREDLPIDDESVDELLAAGFLLPERYRL